jgi:hypothetical protein
VHYDQNSNTFSLLQSWPFQRMHAYGPEMSRERYIDIPIEDSHETQAG